VADPVYEWHHATACGHTFDLDSGGDPLIFCPFCGKKIATGLAGPVVPVALPTKRAKQEEGA
jgi:DNA-directed RNA polymerase subunit RPC12/RpoP